MFFFFELNATDLGLLCNCRELIPIATILNSPESFDNQCENLLKMV